MRLTKNLGMLLLGIWLTIQGLEGLVGLSFRGLRDYTGHPRSRRGDPHHGRAVAPARRVVTGSSTLMTLHAS